MFFHLREEEPEGLRNQFEIDLLSYWFSLKARVSP